MCYSSLELVVEWTYKKNKTIMKVQSYNGGKILKITNQGVTFFWDAIFSTKIPNGSSQLNNLIADILSVSCAKVCIPEPFECAPFNLVSNSGACLVSNSGAFIVSNQA